MLRPMSSVTPQERPLAPTEAEVLTVEEAATVLRISRTLAFAAVRDGELPSVRIGRRVLVPRARLEAFLRGEQHP
jgi:excisionase family DNA binding protein